jgi:hypothetical protein
MPKSPSAKEIQEAQQRRVGLAQEMRRVEKEVDDYQWFTGWNRQMARAFKGIVHPRIRLHYLQRAGRKSDD